MSRSSSTSRSCLTTTVSPSAPLAANGEPLHPNKEIREKNQGSQPPHHPARRKARLPVVVDFSGCPGDSENAKYPNWVTSPWPPHFQELLKWQWESVAIPFWSERTKFAADHGVKIALEMHPGFLVHSPETMLRLRAACGPNIGANLDPSHMFWQGIDPIKAVRVLGDAIFYVHAKDTKIYEDNLPSPASST